ncbi:peptidyl-dipeptidase Dcp Metallo peptidase. MEROPS family M03A [Alistipes timonensis JC136]|uniref:Peptidyl-dipeptidase Dcp Metallo peptidase. MEROPS family M03A n=1 Tax=Alistipes timonensis JC136 TaxID=1033731 RepID=A0A1H4FGX4_9BACT|nr:M3 family metallopeptidase [Alistipes timonensis]SEA95732.1 peptidyl-dipeptidase Dcp Metallo peptidase. MEROPS family M03A [Alistipes timonensis JC136]
MKRITAFLTLFLVMALASCKSDKNVGENPFFAEWNTPYGVPPFDRMTPAHFLPALERGMSLHDAEIDAITSDNDAPTFENVILAYDDSGQMLAQTELIFGMLCAAENTAEMQALQEQVMPMLAAHADKILLNEKLFERVKAVYDRRAALELDADQSRLLEKTYRGFVRAGALLDAEQKARLKAINGELSLASVKFGQNILAENNNYTLMLESSDLDGISANVRDQAREKAEAMGKKGKYAFTLHKPSLIPFLTYSQKRELREEIYKAYLNRCNNGDEYDNKQLINDFIRLRTEKAHLLGYPSYADYVVDDEMAGTTDAVYKLLNEIWTPALESAKGELAEMEELFKKDHPDGEFASWDWWYYAEKVRKQKYQLEEEQLRPYFSLENVQSGIFFLANRLYGITFRPIVVPLYHPDAIAYEVLDADESHLGVLYFDYFPRDGKSQGAWCGNYVEQTYKDGRRVAPVVSIVCNFTRPTSSAPALLTLDETETLFHEFGHALHFLFHDVKYRGLTEVEGDFVELPSQLMENWAFDPEVLKQYAVHYRSNEVIPAYLVEKLRRSELFNQGFMTTELIAAALSDMDIHSISEYEPFDPMEFERKALTEKRGLIPQIEPRYRYPYFSHIFDGGYSAGYYFYTWAEVLDKDVFEAFRESGDLFNKRIADDFRRKILARGGSEDGMAMYRDFRGKDPDKRAMLRSRGLWNEPEPVDSLAGSPEPAEGFRVKAVPEN